jgi:hypothetical protein
VSLASFLALIVRTLKDADVPFMLTGSLAAAFYGAPRATQDLDLIIDAQPDNLHHGASWATPNSSVATFESFSRWLKMPSIGSIWITGSMPLDCSRRGIVLREPSEGLA